MKRHAKELLAVDDDNPLVTFPFLHTEYMRTNKGLGHKNLRCFPQCLEGGHRTDRFCGRPLIAEVRLPAGGASGPGQFPCPAAAESGCDFGALSHGP